jgi:hypothetical protein
MLFTTNYKQEEFQSYGQTTNDVAYLPAGIHENIALTEVRVDKSPNKGINFIEFTFKDIHGNVCKTTEFEPTKRNGEDEFSFQQKVENKMRRILQIVRIYSNDNFEANTFEEMIQWVKKTIDAKKDQIAVRIKVIYEWVEKANGKGADYTSTPRYWKYTFIEPMTVSAGQSKIKILSIDKVERTYVPDKETNTVNKYAPPVTANVEDDLPF